jgi:photosystem II stability/assembly factor-like uncharacterized protein
MAPNTLKGWVVASDTNGYVLHTPDCGLTWINQSFSTGRYLYDIFFLNDQKGWIGTDQGFIFYSPNGGQNWYWQVMGLAYFAYRLLFINDSCGWAGCQGAIIARTHGGQNYSWEPIMLPYPQFHPDTVDVCGISFVDRQKGWFCAGCYVQDFYPHDTLFGGQGYIAVSNDSGLNWQLLLRDTINDFFDIKMLDSLNGFVVGGNDRTMSATIMKTQNGGVTWQPVTIPSQAKYLRSLKIIGTNKIWAVGHHGTILHSDDGGNTWALQTSPIDTTLYDIDFSDSIHGLIADDGCVLYSHDGGNTWNVSNIGIEEEIASHPLATTPSIKVSPNPAKTLTTIRFSLPAEGNVSLQLFDISGRLVKTLTSQEKNADNYSLIWNGTDENNRKVGEGVYFCILKTDEKSLKQKILMVK